MTDFKKDLLTEQDVQLMVDTFYEKVNNDAMLAPVFNDFAEVDWLHHLPKMYQFWNFVILGIAGYKGQPFPMHSRLPVTSEHFRRWLELFTQNMDALFSGENATMAKEKANNIANVFQYKLGLKADGNFYR
jgi:hemoglobin